MHDAAAGRHTAESHVDMLIKLDGDLQGGQSEWLAGWDKGAIPALPWLGLARPPAPSPPSRGAHLPDVPVNIPLAHVAEAPGLDYITHGQVYSDQSVVGNA